MAMSQEHKDALARGRKEARAVKAYLRALGSRRPGRPVTKESLESRLSKVAERLGSTDDPLKRVELYQSKLDIVRSLASMEEARDMTELESEFVAHAKSYSERKGISYTAWRQSGVPAEVLRRAGIGQTRRR